MNRNNMCRIKTYSIYFKALVGLFCFVFSLLDFKSNKWQLHLWWAVLSYVL